MRVRTFAALMVALLLAVPVAAQELRGSIEGVVKDTSGAVLPGATVEAKAANGATLSTTSDATGTFRFPAVAPGSYVVTANLQGFRTGTVSDVIVGLGQMKKVDFALALQGVAETVQVTAESPLVDVRQSARQTNIRSEQVELLPKGRDFTTLVTQAPGANREARLGGLSIDGASASENRYIIDGIETTNLQNGLSGKDLIADFVEEVQVKSSGYTAEYGGATGGVVNAITKSGSNNWRGSALFNYEGDKLSGGSVPAQGFTGFVTNTGVPTNRLKLSNPNESEFITYPEDKVNRIEPGFSLGGPIFTNRAWFFGAYQPALIEYTRDVDPTTSGNPGAVTRSTTRKTQVQFATGNFTTQLSDALRARLAFNNSWERRDGLLQHPNGTEPATTDYSKISTFPNYSVSGNMDWVASPHVFFGVRGGYYLSDQYDSNVPEEPLYQWLTTSNVGLPGVPSDLQRPTGFSSLATNTKVFRDKQTRAYFQADSTMYASFAGQHQFKVGVQADRIGNDVLSGEARNRVQIFWDQLYNSADPTSRGTFGYYTVRSNGVEPKTGFITQGNISTTNVGLFLQDQWTIASRFTVNLGVRTEREKVPAYLIGEGVPQDVLDFSFADKFAPRIGFAYDIKGDGRTKVFGNWGIFYDIFKLELPRGSFGGDKWWDYTFALDTPNWTTLVDAADCPPACPGRNVTGGAGYIDLRQPSFGADAIDPDLKPMKSQEASLGIDHQLNDVMAVGVRYVHKQIDRAVEDTGFLTADGHEGYVIANPGEGLTQLAWPGVALPKAVRDYDSVEAMFEKRLAANWYLRSSYLWSRLYGNYSGLSQSDEAGRTSPNVGRAWDHPTMMFDQHGQPVLGSLNTDRPHQFKTQFIYQFPMGTSLGLNQYVASGVPITRDIAIVSGHNYPVQYLGRGSDGRTDVYSQTDLLVQHEFRMGGRRLQLSLNVLNLFDQQTVTSVHTAERRTGALNITEADFFAGRLDFESLIRAQTTGLTLDPRFLQPNSYQTPINARVGVKFLF
jgi:outer membrane receptor protein involved in Fe transport